MLRITLYKQCILNETYTNVFSLGLKANKTILEHYLTTLTKKVYEIDYVYQENSGQLVFPFEIDSNNDIYDFNYMKVETIGEGNLVEILRYCFVQEIILKNDLVYVSYSEDMWHSYAGKITGITESYLNASRITDYENGFSLKVRALPFEYKGNKSLSQYIEIGNNTYQNATFVAIIEIQTYLTNQLGEETEREVHYVITDFYPSQNSNADIEGKTLYNLVRHLIYFESQKSVSKVTISDSAVEYNYEIGKIYIVPFEFKIQNYYDTTGRINWGVYKLFFLNGNLGPGMKIVKTVTVTNNFKRLSIGTFSTQLPCYNNGNSFDVSLVFYATEASVSLYLSTNNSITDITKDFLFNLPIAGVNSEQLSLLRLQRELNSKNITNEIYTYTSKVAYESNETSMWKKIGSAFAKLFNPASALSAGTDFWDATQKLKEENLKTSVERDKLQNALTENDAPYYTSNKGVNANNENLVNSLFGIVSFFCTSQNDDFVKKSINNMGHVAYEYLNDISKLRLSDVSYFYNKSINYNVIKFKAVNCYGSFARNTALVLNSILESGVKIWYTETLAEDNYSVD